MTASAVEPLVGVSLNFDSLFFPLSIDRSAVADPSFLGVADRFLALATKRNFRYTIFIIGRDLENPEVAGRVRAWAAAGHEIANHSYSHNRNLGSLPGPLMEYEVLKSHELITACVGREPRGFVSPSWSTSRELVAVLTRAGYLYDTSVFPSYVQLLVLLKLRTMSANGRRGEFSLRRRRDKRAFFLAPRRPYFVHPSSLVHPRDDGLLMMPLPVVTPLRIPCWHTMFFVFGARFTKWVMRQALREHRFFYYLVHPRDLVDYEQDLPLDLRREFGAELRVFEGLTVPIERKLEFMERALELMAATGRRWVTLLEMAETIIAERGATDAVARRAR